MLSIVVLFAVVYSSLTRTLSQQTQQELQRDGLRYQQQFEQDGLNAVTRLLSSNLARSENNQQITSIVNSEGQVVASNFDNKLINDTDWITHQFTLNNGHYIVLIARSVSVIKKAQSNLIKAFWLAIAIVFLVIVFASHWLAKSAVKRISAINALCTKIINGQLSARLKTTTAGDDLDALSININRMLDRISALMQEVEHVSHHIAHDLRTPLTHLKNELTRVKSNAPSQRQELDQCINHTDNLLSTFNSLLRISKIESRAKNDNFTQINAQELITDLVELYQPLAEEKQITLVSDNAEKALYCDKNLMFQAATNLLDNAIKFTPTNGSVHVRVQDCKDKLVLWICDTGPGIADKEKNNVTKPFYRIDNSRTTQGNGIGLSMVHAIAKLHQGRLVLNNNKPTGLCAGLEINNTHEPAS